MRLRRGIQWHEVTQDNFFKPNISETNSMSTASSIAISLLVDSLSLSNPKNNLMMRRAGFSNSKTLKQKQKSRERDLDVRSLLDTIFLDQFPQKNDIQIHW